MSGSKAWSPTKWMAIWPKSGPMGFPESSAFKTICGSKESNRARRETARLDDRHGNGRGPDPGSPRKKRDTGRHRNVQRGNRPGHGDAHQRITVSLNEIVQAFALATHYDHRFFGPRHGVESQIAALVESIDKIAFAFEAPQYLVDIDRPHHRQVFECTGG